MPCLHAPVHACSMRLPPIRAPGNPRAGQGVAVPAYPSILKHMVLTEGQDSNLPHRAIGVCGSCKMGTNEDFIAPCPLQAAPWGDASWWRRAIQWPYERGSRAGVWVGGWVGKASQEGNCVCLMSSVRAFPPVPWEQRMVAHICGSSGYLCPHVCPLRL